MLDTKSLQGAWNHLGPYLGSQMHTWCPPYPEPAPTQFLTLHGEHIGRSSEPLCPPSGPLLTCESRKRLPCPTTLAPTPPHLHYSPLLESSQMKGAENPLSHPSSVTWGQLLGLSVPGIPCKKTATTNGTCSVRPCENLVSPTCVRCWSGGCTIREPSTPTAGPCFMLPRPRFPLLVLFWALGRACPCKYMHAPAPEGLVSCSIVFQVGSSGHWSQGRTGKGGTGGVSNQGLLAGGQHWGTPPVHRETPCLSHFPFQVLGSLPPPCPPQPGTAEAYIPKSLEQNPKQKCHLQTLPPNPKVPE